MLLTTRRGHGYLLAAAILGVIGACSGPDPGSSTTPPVNSPPTSTSTSTSTTQPPTTTPGATPTSSAPDTEVADTVLLNGKVITVDGDFSSAAAVAITDGRIVAVGNDASVSHLTGESTRVIDLEGRTAMPGIVDPHLHDLQLTALDGLDSIADAESWLIENGRTTVGSPTITPDVLDGLTEYWNSGRSTLRHHVYLSYNDHCDDVLGHWYRDLEFSQDPSEHLAIAGIKLFMDGGTCDAPAVSFEWDTHRWKGQGDLFADAGEVADVVATAEELGAQIVFHQAGDRALDAALEGLELALPDGINANRHRIDHLMFVRPDQLDRLGQLGVPPVMFGTHQTCLDTEDSRVVRYLDDETIGWLEPRRAIIDSNPQVPPAWHSDTPWLTVDIFEQLAGLTGIGERLGSEGGCESESLVDHAVTTEEAIRMMTIGAAHAMHLESAVGSIEVGKVGDLVILANDPLPHRGEGHLDNSVVATIIKGELVWCDDDQASFCGPGSSPSTDSSFENSPVSASAHLPGNEPHRAVDGDPDLGWMSGAFAPQWIEIDLGDVAHVALLRLRVDQHPPGFTRHIVLGGPDPAPTDQLAVLEGETDYGEVLEIEVGEDVRYLRIETVESPSWVSWLEIEVVTEP